MNFQKKQKHSSYNFNSVRFHLLEFCLNYLPHGFILKKIKLKISNNKIGKIENLRLISCFPTINAEPQTTVNCVLYI